MDNNSETTTPMAVRLERRVRRSELRVRLFKSLPLGTRFKYQSGTQVWVILERHGCGLIAKWEGVDGGVDGQAICSFTDTPEECETTEVMLCDA